MRGVGRWAGGGRGCGGVGAEGDAAAAAAEGFASAMGTSSSSSFSFSSTETASKSSSGNWFEALKAEGLREKAAEAVGKVGERFREISHQVDEALKVSADAEAGYEEVDVDDYGEVGTPWIRERAARASPSAGEASVTRTPRAKGKGAIKTADQFSFEDFLRGDIITPDKRDEGADDEDEDEDEGTDEGVGLPTALDMGAAANVPVRTEGVADGKGAARGEGEGEGGGAGGAAEWRSREEARREAEVRAIWESTRGVTGRVLAEVRKDDEIARLRREAEARAQEIAALRAEMVQARHGPPPAAAATAAAAMESVSSAPPPVVAWNPADAMAKARREAAQSLDQASGRILQFISSAVSKAEEAAKRAAGAGPDLEVGDAKRRVDGGAPAAEAGSSAAAGGGSGGGGASGVGRSALFAGGPAAPVRPKPIGRVQAEVSALLRGSFPVPFPATSSSGLPLPPQGGGAERVGESAVANTVAQALAVVRHQPRLVAAVLLFAVVSLYLKLVTLRPRTAAAVDP